ncbi:protein-lysine deacetylase [Salmonella enterica subsp. enterica serovar Choleraesuis]|nr:protein-lysine deacetylase [Salmonella enterica subsp. enterica serovar Choleraesuis]
MVNLVIVSHSAQLGQGVGELARQMLIGDGCRLAVAAGIDDPENPIGTDPLKVMAAIQSVADADAVLVLMDMGSALLSAETALDLLEPEIAGKVHLCPAPLVEGALAAAVSAATGSGIEKVMRDAQDALQAKRLQLGFPAQETANEVPAISDDGDAQSATVTIRTPNGLHVRPASQLVKALAGFNAQLLLEKEGKCVVPDSINQIALLQVRCRDRVRLIARGTDAAPALAAFQALAKSNFGETLPAAGDAAPLSTTTDEICGEVLRYRPAEYSLDTSPAERPEEESRRLKAAIALTLEDLNQLTALAAEKYSEDIAMIFSGHHILLDDPELLREADKILYQQNCRAGQAWHQVMTGLSQQYRALDDSYLQARYIDVDDLLHRTLRHLAGAEEDRPQLRQQQSIIVADDLFPSMILQLDADRVAAICLSGGSPLAHGAIIARAAGIPFRCQLGDATAAWRTGENLTLDN